MRQWQCSCGAWVDMSHAKHIHQLGERQPTLAEMKIARDAGLDALAAKPHLSAVSWEPHFPRRDKPNGV